MHFELKSISEQSIPEALAKVERYRLCLLYTSDAADE